MFDNNNIPNTDAVFIGWQQNPGGKDFALFNITAENHPIKGSTVTEKSLRRMNLAVPSFLGEKE